MNPRFVNFTGFLTVVWDVFVRHYEYKIFNTWNDTLHIYVYIKRAPEIHCDRIKHVDTVRNFKYKHYSYPPLLVYIITISTNVISKLLLERTYYKHALWTDAIQLRCKWENLLRNKLQDNDPAGTSLFLTFYWLPSLL